MKMVKKTPKSERVQLKTVESKASVWSNQRHRTLDHPQPTKKSGSSWAFLHSRRENQLNSMFKIRKTKLSSITKANHIIHHKINQQKTHYPYAKTPQSSHDSQRFLYESKERIRHALGPIDNFQPLIIPKIKEGQEFQFSMDGLSLQTLKPKHVGQFANKIRKAQKARDIFLLCE